MTFLVIAYLGGALTILSPCILPILPFVFARAGQPFLRSTLPLLAGMAATFCAVATLAAVGGSWAISANEYGRLAALALLAAMSAADASAEINVTETFKGTSAPGWSFGATSGSTTPYLTAGVVPGDTDGNGWLLQEVTTRLPGRIDSSTTSFASANDLASALRRAEAAHGQHEKRTGQRDANWPDWYAAYMVAEQAGAELPQ